MTADVVLISSDEEDDGYHLSNFNLEEQLDPVIIISDDGDHLSNFNLKEQLDPVIIISDDDADVAGDDEEKKFDDEDYVILISDDDEGDGDDERESDEVSDARRDKFDCFLQGSKALQELSLCECESYLRKHGIRVSGTKEECIQRIEEHKRLKDGHGESLYPISSFSINCTGDACRGDVVLFKQHIKKGQKIVGKRTVTGRILEESYGESDQQHTFSVEVLWSKQYKKLNPLSILLVKGRHLYMLGTFRQPWGNEAERLEVLAEKHCRGDAARLKRKLRQTEFGCYNYKGAKRQKVSHILSFQSKEPIQIDKQMSANEGGAASLKESTSAHKRKAVPVRLQKLKFKRATQLTFRLDLKPNQNRNRKRKRNLNPNLNVHSDHHLQEVSSVFPNDRSSVSCGHRSNGNWGPKRVFYQPSGYHDHNYEQPIPRFRSRYARSSFFINCMGDACIGDVLLFNQNKIRRGNITGTKTTVAGRIVGENYGASERQHTFTVEVLWTKGYLKLSPLSILQVKAWNLYRFGTFRQPWKNERKRSKMLRRKHRRMEAARHKRTLRKACIASINNKAVKRQKVSHKEPSQSKQSTQTDKQKYAKRLGAAIVKKSTIHKRKVVGFQKAELERAAQLTFSSHPTPISNPNQNLTPNPILKPNSTPNPEPKPSPNQNLNPKTTLKPNQNLTLSPNSNQNPSPNSNQNPTSNPHSSPNLNHHMYSDCQLQEASSSATLFYHYDRTLLPNQPHHGFSRDQPLRGFSRDQPHCGFSRDQPHCGFSRDQPHRGFSRDQPYHGLSRDQPHHEFSRNQPPYGFSRNQPPSGFSCNQSPYGFSLHNQPPFGLPFEISGYVEQWVRNDIFHEPPGHYSLH